MEENNIDLVNVNINENGEFIDTSNNLLTISANTIEELKEFYKELINKTANLKVANKYKIGKGYVIIDDKGSNIGIHATNDEEMKKVINVLENYYSTSFQKLQFTYMKRREVKKGEGYYLQGLTYNEDYLKSPSFLLKCCDEDKS